MNSNQEEFAEALIALISAGVAFAISYASNS